MEDRLKFEFENQPKLQEPTITKFLPITSKPGLTKGMVLVPTVGTKFGTNSRQYFEFLYEKRPNLGNHRFKVNKTRL